MTNPQPGQQRTERVRHFAMGLTLRTEETLAYQSGTQEWAVVATATVTDRVDGSAGYFASGKWHFSISDQLGTPRVIFNQDGLVVERNHYYPYGLRYSAWSSAPTGSPEEEGFAGGQRVQSELAVTWQRNGVRLYDAALGRFLGVEPLADRYADVSGYLYSLGDPVNFSDASGNAPEEREVDEWWRHNRAANRAWSIVETGSSASAYASNSRAWQLRVEARNEAIREAERERNAAFYRQYGFDYHSKKGKLAASGTLYTGADAKRIGSFLKSGPAGGAWSLVNAQGFSDYVASGHYAADVQLFSSPMRYALASVGAGGCGCPDPPCEGSQTEHIGSETTLSIHFGLFLGFKLHGFTLDASLFNFGFVLGQIKKGYAATSRPIQTRSYSTSVSLLGFGAEYGVKFDERGNAFDQQRDGKIWWPFARPVDIDSGITAVESEYSISLLFIGISNNKTHFFKTSR